MLRKLATFVPVICGVIFATSVIEVSNSKTEFTMQQLDPYVLNVKITTGDIVTFSEMTDEGEYTRLSLPGFHMSYDVGEPELPEIHSLIEVPQAAIPYIEIVSSNYQDYSLLDLGITSPIFPAQPSLSKSQNPEDIPFSINSGVYSKNTLLRKELVSVIIEGQLRAIRIANLNIRPVDYNPIDNILRVYTDLEINIHMEGADYIKTAEIKEKYYSPYFEALYNQIPNYESSTRSDDMISDPVTYLIVANSLFEGYLNEFIDWKTKKGYHVIVGYTGDIGSNASAIENYIHNLYNNPEDGIMPPSFVLLIGDTNQLPASYSSGGHVSDNDYGDVSGDMMPEILYGRFSAQTPMHLQPQIDKTLEYEKFEMSDPSFLGEVVMISGVDASYAPTYGNGQINYGTNYYFNNEHGIYSHTYLYPASGSSGSQIKSDVSDGAAYVNYTAHGYESGWADPSFTNSDVNNLTNDGKYPLMVGNCCLTNAFDTGECFGEKLLRAENKGAVGYIGGSDVTYWNEDYWWGVGNGNITSNPSYNSTGPGAYDCTFHNNGENNWAVVNSTLMVAGNLGVVEAGSSLINYYWEIYHLMGDPSLSTYFGIPSENNLTHTEFLPVGSTSISISGAPYTYVGITHDGNILGSGQINPFGNIELNLSGATIPGTAQIVGTCQNHQPYFGEILIASPEGPYIIVESTSFTAGSGDDSGIIQFGETVDLSLNLENVGNDAANSVQVVLSTADQYVTLTNSSASTSYIASDGTATISGLEFVISTAVPNEYDFELICNISAGNETWESNLSFTAYAPVIEVDAVIGNLDPGVSANLDVHLLNTGGADIHSPMISIIGDSYVTVNSSSFTNAYVWFGGNNNNDETLSVSVSVSTTTPIGHIAEFIIIVNSDQSPTTEYEENVTFSIPVGQVIANFESGLGSLDWNLSCNGIGCTNWGVDNTESYTGSGSAQSGTIGNNQSSDMSVTLDITADGEIEFFYRVSAEYSSSGNYFYDGLEFYIDNTLKGQYQSTTSGGSPWTQVSYDVTEGEHTFRWSYIKDSSGGSTDCNNTGCEDAAWVDDIIFPPAYIESDGILGDLNGDSIINILDVIIMVNIILGVEPESSLADVNGDGTINILDIVQVINLILGPRVDNASSIQLHDTGYELRMKSDGYVGALKIVLKHDELFELNITEDALVSKAHTTQNFTTLVIVAPEYDHLFDYEGFFIIMEVEAANSEQLIPVALPFTTSLNSIFPNPFNPVTTIVYSLAKAGSINLSIYNLRGQLIEILENSFMDAGNYTVVWDASKQPSGIYFLQMKAENKIQNQKLMLVK